jgi:hypothetical protein
MKIKKNTFCTLVLELFFPSIANCRKLKIQKNPKIDFRIVQCAIPIIVMYFFIFLCCSHETGSCIYEAWLPVFIDTLDVWKSSRLTKMPSRISDPISRIFLTRLRLWLFSWKHKQKKKSLHYTFLVRSGMKKCLDPDPGWENGRIRIRDPDRDPG